jgi:hypothetical protein
MEGRGIVGTEKLREQAARCRRLAKELTDKRAIAALLEMAEECEVRLAPGPGGNEARGHSEVAELGERQGRAAEARSPFSAP